MPTRSDKGHTEKQGSGKNSGQKAAYGSARSADVADTAAEARHQDLDRETDDEDG
ncbi:MAG TPA: hypothetical protein VGV93_02360 [Acidimicrobiales bacterium]|nr:hypothetical protein [Acidimicrobiales bacterium]